MSFDVSQLVQTNQFLQSLGCSLANDNSATKSLIDALVKDGFQLQSLASMQQRHLEAEPHPTDPVEIVSNLVPVVVCVICAGFASGLTQVSSARCRIDSLAIS